MHTTNQYLTNKDVKHPTDSKKTNQKIQKHTKQLPQPNSKFHHRKNAKNTMQVQFCLDTTKNFQFKSNMGKKQNQNILTHSIQTIQTKTKNTMPNTRNKPDNTGRIIYKPKQLPR